MFGRWNALSLARQFLVAGIAVSLVAALGVGTVVVDLIERTFIKHAGTATALYVDSIIAPILPDLRTAKELDAVVAQSLDETLSAGKLGERLVSFRLWRGDGTILYSDRPDLIGKKVAPTEDLKRAFGGEVVAEYGEPKDSESDMERALQVPLLEVYTPVLQPWTGEVVAVSEFYESVPDLADELWSVRLKGWAAVALATLGLFLTLSVIVFRGSSTIEAQKLTLSQRVNELARLAENNRALADRVQDASHQATAFNEKFLRRLGADLHDGPAQLIAFAALRIGSKMFKDTTGPSPKKAAEIHAIKESLAEAMDEIRMISSGLAIPHIDTADIEEVITAALHSDARRAAADVHVQMSGSPHRLSADIKTCVFRFVQEALTNAIRHCGTECRIDVNQRYQGDRLIVEVKDDGPGFDLAAQTGERLGLACLRQRVENLGGTFLIQTSSTGTQLTMAIDVKKDARAKWAA